MKLHHPPLYPRFRPLLQLGAACALLFSLASCSPQGENSEPALAPNTDSESKTDSASKAEPVQQAESPNSPVAAEIKLATSSPLEPESSETSTVPSPASESKPTKVEYPLLEDVRIEIVKTGTGATVEKIFDTRNDSALILTYEATLPDGSPVASATREAPFRLRWSDESIIEGWRRGLEGARVGEVRRLQIPARYAYGQRGLWDQDSRSYSVPPGSSVFIQMEILESES